MKGRVTISRSREELKEILSSTKPPTSLIPELIEAAKEPELVCDRPSAPMVQGAAEPYLADIENIPRLTYTRYREVQRYTNRYIYRVPQFEKRAKMATAAVQVLFGRDEYLSTLHDYIWSTCEETKWILPQREDLEIDLRVCGTGFTMAELIVGLEHRLEDRVVKRVRKEIDRRVFARYLDRKEGWWKGHNNWNGVCNGAIGTAFLLLEKDEDRLARAVATVLEGLETFLNVAFTGDGGCEEGPGYWQYGMSNLVCFSEALRQRTGGEIDLLATDRVKEIAAYPPKVMLSPGHYFSYSDSSEESAFHPGLVQRLAERSGVEELLKILAKPGELQSGWRRFHEMWRALMWWDGTRPKDVKVEDSMLPATEVVRLTGETTSGASVVLAAKAGHNAASHNHNDVGVFVLHVDGETFICDPGSGAYSVRYFSEHRYENIFANSYGHSVPRIGEQLQSVGKEYAGEYTEIDTDGDEKRVEMRIEGAYNVLNLEKLNRLLVMSPEGDVTIEDTFGFSETPLAVEEAFVTWRNTMVSGNTALLVGENHVLELTIEAPRGPTFELEVLKEESEANRKEVPLKRLAFVIEPADREMVARVRARVLPA